MRQAVASETQLSSHKWIYFNANFVCAHCPVWMASSELDADIRTSRSVVVLTTVRRLVESTMLINLKAINLNFQISLCVLKLGVGSKIWNSESE